MSFKRDGDNLSLLRKLKRQRVSELLGTYIPEDEAKLLRNGRLTCTICLHHPVFDTVAMLSAHRKGIKHLLELSRYMKRKQDLAHEMVKKQQLDAAKVLNVQMSVQSVICSRTLSGREYHPDSVLRKTLSLPKYSLIPFSKHESSPKHLCGSEVRHYLNTLHRKRSLKSLEECKRKNYGHQTTTKQNLSLTEKKDSSIEPLKEIIINKEHL